MSSDRFDYEDCRECRGTGEGYRTGPCVDCGGTGEDRRRLIVPVPDVDALKQQMRTDLDFAVEQYWAEHDAAVDRIVERFTGGAA